MLTNYHTHTMLCDGKSTPEEVVLSAIEKGFDAIGFSGHAYTDFDFSYCMRDMNTYIRIINDLKEKYKDKIQIYRGIEEDMYCLCNRADFEYLIGSCHYLKVNDTFYPIDSDQNGFNECVNAFDGDLLKLTESYYKSFCDYILSRKPDIIGHFDLITKYDELEDFRLLNNKEYQKLAKLYIGKALESECFFEVNTGAISRGYRTFPYPSTELLHFLQKNNGKVILNSDSHSADTIDCEFAKTKEYLKEIGFTHTYHLYNNEFVKKSL